MIVIIHQESSAVLNQAAKKFLKILVESSKEKSTQTLITNASEAEAIKPFQTPIWLFAYHFSMN